MIETYKNTGEKIKIGNRNACIYTKGNRKTKYIKSNKEFVLLSKFKITKKQLGGGDEIKDKYKELTINYTPQKYSLLQNNSNKYENTMHFVENSGDNPPASGSALSYMSRSLYKKSLEIYYCSKIATKKFVNDLLTTTLKFSERKINVVKWIIPDTAVVLIIGDIHGDIIALEKVLKNWIFEGYLIKQNESIDEVPKYITKEGVYIISTGDLIDYGSKSINVLCAMLRLRNDNPEKVMLLCGNHEAAVDEKYTFSGRESIGKEKLKYNESEKDIITKTMENISFIGPDMLALHFGNELQGTYFMHGMYPFKYTEYPKEPNTSKFSYWPEDTTIIKSTELMSELIQWNDVSENGISGKSIRGVSKCVTIGTKELSTIMNKYGIKGFIRGHQDACATQGYPLEGYDKCLHTENIKHIYDQNKRECKNGVGKVIDSDKKSNWCETGPINYNWEELKTDSEDEIKEATEKLKYRIITTSMANQKAGIAPLGGYIKLTVKQIT